MHCWFGGLVLFVVCSGLKVWLCLQCGVVFVLLRFRGWFML